MSWQISKQITEINELNSGMPLLILKKKVAKHKNLPTQIY